MGNANKNKSHASKEHDKIIERKVIESKVIERNEIDNNEDTNNNNKVIDNNNKGIDSVDIDNNDEEIDNEGIYGVKKQYFIIAKNTPSHVFDQLLKLQQSLKHSLGLQDKSIFSTRILSMSYQNECRFQYLIEIFWNIDIYNGKYFSCSGYSLYNSSNLLLLTQSFGKIKFQNLKSFCLNYCNVQSLEFISSMNAESLQMISFIRTKINSLKPFAKTNFKYLKSIDLDTVDSKVNSIQCFTRTKMNSKFQRITHLDLFVSQKQQNNYSLFKTQMRTKQKKPIWQQVQDLFFNSKLKAVYQRRFKNVVKQKQ